MQRVGAVQAKQRQKLLAGLFEAFAGLGVLIPQKRLYRLRGIFGGIACFTKPQCLEELRKPFPVLPREISSLVSILALLPLECRFLEQRRDVY